MSVPAVMQMNLWAAFASYLVSMLAITNPFGNLAIFISLTSDRSLQQQRQTAMKTAVASAIIFLVMTWIGDPLLSLLGISLPAFQVAGGMVVAMVGFSMLQSKKSEVSHTEHEQESALEKASIAVVPLAMPIIAGPGAMSTVLITVHQYSDILSKLLITGANLLVALVIAAVLFFANPISKLLGTSGISITVRLMGLVLIAMAVGMIAAGALALFPGLK